jgi:hypothetical protein
MIHKVSFGKTYVEYNNLDVIDFTSDAVISVQHVTIQIGAYRELATDIGWHNKITLIKIVRGLCCDTNGILALKFAKDIVEWFELHITDKV